MCSCLLWFHRHSQFAGVCSLHSASSPVRAPERGKLCIGLRRTFQKGQDQHAGGEVQAFQCARKCAHAPRKTRRAVFLENEKLQQLFNFFVRLVIHQLSCQLVGEMYLSPSLQECELRVRGGHLRARVCMDHRWQEPGPAELRPTWGPPFLAKCRNPNLHTDRQGCSFRFSQTATAFPSAGDLQGWFTSPFKEPVL